MLKLQHRQNSIVPPNDSGSGLASELTTEPLQILETVDGAAATHMPDPRPPPPRSHRRSCGTGVIGSDVPWLECPAYNALTWVITVTE